MYLNIFEFCFHVLWTRVPLGTCM